MAWAASAPMRFYSQATGQYDYYKVVTESAETVVPGCPAAVRGALAKTLAIATKDDIVAGLNLCTPLPAYLDAGDAHLLQEEVSMVLMYSFANLNMANWPPPNTSLRAACTALVENAGADAWKALSTFLSSYSAVEVGAGGCYNLSSQLPSGRAATISSGDWTGVGTGQDGSSWDFETCTFLVEQIGVNGVTDMFLPREWTIEWMNAHCQDRFGVTPQPRTLADLWGFDEDRLPSITSRIIFTNGLQDGWSAGGIQGNLVGRECLGVPARASATANAPLPYVFVIPPE
jgi:hypothetical protein